jgi:hypothetical protein
MTARAHDYAEATRRHLRQSGGGLGYERGVPGIGIDHAGAEPEPGRDLRRRAEPREHLARPFLVVVEERVEAEQLGKPDLLQEARARLSAERCD